MGKIQVVFKGKDKDIIIAGDTLDEIVNEYDQIKEKIGKLVQIAPIKPSKKQDGTLAKASATVRILALKNEGFFQKPKDIAEIQEQLAAKGYHYAQTSLSGPLLGLVRKNELRRYKNREIRGRFGFTLTHDICEVGGRSWTKKKNHLKNLNFLLN